MIIDAKDYNGLCRCGRVHKMTTDLCVVERGSFGRLPEYAASVGLKGKSVAVCDGNTFAAVGGAVPTDGVVVLDPEGLHPDDRAIELLRKQLPADAGYLAAVGGGSIHDLTRFLAAERGIPFVSCPTCASVDGFCSSVAALTLKGFKKTLPAVAPSVVVADVDVISRAPARLARSGFGDLMGKFISLADWRIGVELTGEYFCPEVCELTESAAKKAMEKAEGIGSGDPDSIEALTAGLLMSGLAMQLLGNSRCASGAEHHVSHLLELHPDGLREGSEALHGEKVGVGTLIASGEYHRLVSDGEIFRRDYPAIDPDDLRRFFGDGLWASVMEENKNDAAAGITAKLLEAHRDGVTRIVEVIPTRERLLEIYASAGLLTRLEDIGVSGDRLGVILKYSPLVRNRLTLMRLARSVR